MADINIAAILRAGIYSPNHIGNDAAIINLTAEQLRKRGCRVNIYTEEQAIADEVKEDIILQMCRDPQAIAAMQRREEQGAMVINSAFGVENCMRERMARILIGSGIPYPESLMVATDRTVTREMHSAGMERAWIKRGDLFAQHKEDVTFVRHPEEAQEVLQEYFMRGIKRAVINRHLDGRQVKFYGIAGTGYFHWFYPLEKAYTPGGTDTASAEPEPCFDLEAFKATCSRAAEALDIMIYGGDAMVDPADGTFTIIDFNDWPGFGPCSAEASAVIARAVLSRIKQAKQTKK